MPHPEQRRPLARRIVRFPRVFLLRLLRRLRSRYRRLFHAMEGPVGPAAAAVNARVGHVAVAVADPAGMIVIWGGYREGRPPVFPKHAYWPPEWVLVYNPFEARWSNVETSGEVPNGTSGATAVSVGSKIFVLCGFIKGRFVAAQDGDDVVDYIEPEANTNDVYSLDVGNWKWTKHIPKGIPPMKCDKLTSWRHDGKIFLFGGFGPHCDAGSASTRFVRDTMINSDRGWNNQLVCFDPAEDAFSWPECYGEAPDPRAAHAAVCSAEHGVFVFGGRMLDDRTNDLFHLDMARMRWTRLRPPVSPLGRSWHSLTLVSDSMAVLFGGYNSEKKALFDCWTLDLSNPANAGLSRWRRCSHLESDEDRRLWHQAVKEEVTGEVWLMGGVMDDLLDFELPFIRHPRATTRLAFSPLPLVQLALKTVVKEKLQDEVSLPQNVKSLVPLCKSAGA